MQKITPHLWFDKEAKEAAAFYTAIFPDSRVKSVRTIHDTPSGDCDIVSLEIMGYSFMAISAGPYFNPNPSISFMINFDPSKMENARETMDEMWQKLSEGGTALMPLDAYPFSEHYGWMQDKYGFSWQLILTKPEGEERPLVIPSLLFVKKKSGKAKEARDFYLSVFKNAKEGASVYYEADTPAHQKKGDVMFADFTLEGVWFAAMDGGDPHDFDFSEAISFIVHCDTQEEIDYYWEKLSAVPEAEQCGWVKDKYGVSWQIVPTAMEQMMAGDDQDRQDRVTRAFLKMKKFDIAELRKAADGT